ncbi:MULTISPECIES: serine-threonine protein kinase [unclassified Streptomyces]|uniref:serine-threonine protein kinase n=1 Tax=unclassified Streptomyces TaxID=2593676 RepID=UPI0019D28FC2|nr:serine-threonine protein kinase [Streptomyces sp. A1136]
MSGGAAWGTGVGVAPYAELVFDSDGDPAPGTGTALDGMEATDLLVFAHGWNSEPTTSTLLYDRFFAPFPGLVGPAVRLGYAGVLWPSIRFADEPIPDFDPRGLAGALAEPGFGTALDPDTRRALGQFWPGRAEELDRIAELLEDRPESQAAFVEFGALVRELAGVAAVPAATGEDIPAMFTEDVLEVCRRFTEALIESGGAANRADLSLGGGMRALWGGAKEVLRQATYYEMKKRAGVIGERGLGPVLARLATRRPALRVHLVGHSFGGRVVSFSLRAVPDDARYVKSLTLLQGAFSHYAFTDRLPHDKSRGGALHGLQRAVDGPVVACHSSYDTALKVFYPLASRMAGDSAGLLGLDERWGALGHDGVQAVPGAPRLTLAAALRDGLPTTGCVSVDAGAVVRRGGAPTGAHSDICHEELARIVVAAGRMGR